MQLDILGPGIIFKGLGYETFIWKGRVFRTLISQPNKPLKSVRNQRGVGDMKLTRGSPPYPQLSLFCTLLQAIATFLLFLTLFQDQRL